MAPAPVKSDEPAGTPPFFIVGSGRSGTTLLQSILATHSRVAIPPETQFLGKALTEAKTHLRGDKVLDVEAVLEALRSSPYMKPLAPFAATERFDRDRRWTVGQVIDGILTPYARSLGKSRWGEKTPHHLWFWRDLDRMFPACKFIIIARDGRDVACSLSKVPWASDNLFLNAFRWKVELRKANGLESALGPGRVMRVYYEDLVREPEKTVRALCRFLDLEYEPEMVRDFHKNRQVIHDHEWAWKSRNVGELSAASIGRYRRELSSRTVARLNGLLEAELRSTGRYEVDDNLPHAVERIGVYLYSGFCFYASFGGRFIRKKLGRFGGPGDAGQAEQDPPPPRA